MCIIICHILCACQALRHILCDNLNMDIFGKRLKEVREAKGLSQIDLAKVLNTSRQNISRWELGQFEPNQETIVTIAKHFDISADYLLGLSDTE